MMRIPFCPMPVNKARKVLRSSLYGIAEPLLKAFPNVEVELKQTEFGITARDYFSIVIFSSLFMFFTSYLSFLVIVIQVISAEKAFSVSFFVGVVFFVITFFYLLHYPKLAIRKRTFDIERNLVYALRHMYVQITSGVPVFDAMVSVAEGGYGAISTEFKAAIKTINTGLPVDKALDQLTTRNPSPYFRRIVWQIANGVKSGSDLGIILRNIIDYISSEQRIALKKYGSQLNPMTLAYMMVAVIIPSLGVTFLIVLSSFAKIPIGETMFWAILAFLVIFQFMFLGVIKSKRPNII